LTRNTAIFHAENYGSMVVFLFQGELGEAQLHDVGPGTGDERKETGVERGETEDRDNQ
jgi:hypothetical protein